ncbi:MAG: TonB-dependent receptor [Saprospiraceae bacterium]|nr:TonB-dependent receptor [Saprospiraceae bacterium]MDW8483028.1 TonB-dependent receptor [Saprospiraceae bacterium]
MARFLLSLTFSFVAVATYAQTVALKGLVSDAENNAPIVDAAVVLSQTGLFGATDTRGRFTILRVPVGRHTLIVSRAGYLPEELEVVVEANKEDLIIIQLKRDPKSAQANITDIPTILLEEAEESDGYGEIANLLHASRDIFQTAANFGWSVFRFRERGYDSEHFPLYLNGFNVNDPESGITFFGELGGLNDVLRARQSVIGLEPAEFAFSEIGGASYIDTRASIQRKQLRVSYAISNRTYRHRLMLTASTGLMPRGWAVSFSASRRWAQEGWYEGTFFDGYAYFLSVDKKFGGDRHSLNLTVLGSPTVRGRVGDTFQEMYDLAGTTRYNPFWGYWNGEKRNGYVNHNHQPIVMLRYDLKPSRQTSVMLVGFLQTGRNGSTRLDWFNANNPEPDFNRRLPSALVDPKQAAEWADMLRQNENLRQIDWAGLWEANTISVETIADANGIPGNNVTGKRSQYVIADFRSDSRELGVNLVLRQSLSSRFTLNGGGSYHYYLGRNFKTVDDLLGGDFIVDWDRFAQQDVPDNPSARDNDLRTPNRIVRQGEIYGFDYDENIRKGMTWVQVQGNLKRLFVFAAAENLFTTFWRTGHMQNGRFPDESLGNSKKHTFLTYGLKAGLTYKFSGRHYAYVHGFHGTRAPLFRDVFLSPRTRNQSIDAKPYAINSLEAGYLWRAPLVRARLTGFYTTFESEYDNFLFYAAVTGVFGSSLLTNINRRHAGIEAAVEVRPATPLTLTFAGNLGEYIYTNRPTLYLTQDNTADVILNGVTVYQKNFYVPRTPQTTAYASARYEGKRFWFASLTLNWADNSWFLFDQTRRTASFIEPFERGSELWNLILDQQKAPAAFTVDFFGGKSWRIRSNYFLYFNIGVNNLLNNTNIIISGRDAYRNAYRNDTTDPRLYTTQVLYAPGINYFASLALRM